MHFLADVIPPAAGGEIQMSHWIAFAVFVTVMLVLDLTVFHKKSHEPSLRESAFWTCFWSALALGFNGLVWWWLGSKPAIEFLTGYLVEWSLSMDNVFVFAVVFAYFGVPLKYQYRVLFWGILGAVIMRLTFVLLGAELDKRLSVWPAVVAEDEMDACWLESARVDWGVPVLIGEHPCLVGEQPCLVGECPCGLESARG